MKLNNLLSALLLWSLLFQSCTYDDSEIFNRLDNLENRVQTLEESIEGINNNIETLQKLTEALQKNLFITEIEELENGYQIIFSDGSTAVISNGEDGTNAPVISVRQDEDGNYYWTIDGEWLMMDGERIRANGTDAITPQIRINPEDYYWEISYDGGITWESTGVSATVPPSSENGSSSSIQVDNSNEEFVLFILQDGSSISIPRYDDSVPKFIIEDVGETELFTYSQSRTFNITTENIADYSISKPDGWRVSLENNILTITAPSQENTFAETEGIIAFNLVSANNRVLIVKLSVEINVFELRILTFEDGTERFAPFSITGFDGTDYYEHRVEKWSDLIDTPEYGGPLAYGDMGFNGEGRGCDYHWYDENNTFLASEFPFNYNTQVYWGGGEVISNYASTDCQTNGSLENQQTVFGTPGAGGRNGSPNFAMHYGYKDGSPYNMTENLPYIYFGDGVARVIDHMYVNNSCYAIACYTDGNGLTASIGEGDWVKALATGYDADGNVTGNAEIYLCNGPENIVTEWTKWDLTPLGEVLLVEFNITGSSDNGYGFSQPSYFGYDDIAVRF